MAAAIAMSGGTSELGLGGGRKPATVWLLLVGAGGGAAAAGTVAGGVVFFTAVWVAFFGFAFTGGGSTVARTTSGAGVSGFSGSSSGNSTAIVGARSEEHTSELQ